MPRGAVQRHDTGRPEIVYGRKCKQTEITHEVQVAELELHLKARLIREAKVGETEADATTVLYGRRCFIEVDCSGRMSLKRWKKKCLAYCAEPDQKFVILVVAATERRREALRKSSELVKNKAYFTSWDALKAGKEWTDWYGKPIPM